MARRAMLGRSLLYEPKLLVLDEPFAGIDLMTRSRLIDLLCAERQRRKFTCIFVLHEPDAAVRLTDKIYYFGRNREFAEKPLSPSEEYKSRLSTLAKDADLLFSKMSSDISMNLQ
jgi:sulfonate transport system ATP-binding protein